MRKETDWSIGACMDCPHGKWGSTPMPSLCVHPKIKIDVPDGYVSGKILPSKDYHTRIPDWCPLEDADD